MIRLTYYSGVPRETCNPITNRARKVTLGKWEDRLGNVFGGFTKYPAKGHWEGETEDSVTYVIVFSEIAVPDWEPIAKNFKLSLGEALAQSEVLVTWEYLGGLL